MTTTFLPAVPQAIVKVDRDKVLRQGMDLGKGWEKAMKVFGLLAVMPALIACVAVICFPNEPMSLLPRELRAGVLLFLFVNLWAFISVAWKRGELAAAVEQWYETGDQRESARCRTHPRPLVDG